MNEILVYYCWIRKGNNKQDHYKNAAINFDFEHVNGLGVPGTRCRIQKQPVRCRLHLKVEKPCVKFMIAFKIIVVKTKFIVAKYE